MKDDLPLFSGRELKSCSMKILRDDGSGDGGRSDDRLLASGVDDAKAADEGELEARNL